MLNADIRQQWLVKYGLFSLLCVSVIWQSIAFFVASADEYISNAFQFEGSLAVLR